MNLIPKINGRVRTGEGSLKVTLPLTYQGNCYHPDEFALASGGENACLTFLMDENIPAEGYKLEIDEEGIALTSADEAGQYYGLVTLMAMICENKELAVMVIEDAPRFNWRGMMLDVSRHFFPVEEVKKLLDAMAALKMNRFHWHLSDDQGFRIESKRFPKLNEIGSWWLEDDGTKYGGFYTQEEIRDVVAYAAKKQIMVIPEIDLPGHTSAIVAAYPEFSCDGEPSEVKKEGGIYPHILCGADPAAYEFLYALIDEVTDLFPGPYFHLGGDEAPKNEWKKCEKCQALIREKGLAGEEGLQAYFTEQLVNYLAKKGKTAIGWNEILKSGALGADTWEAPEGANETVGSPICQYWAEMGKPYSYPHVARGQKFIFSNNPCLYLDYPHAMVSMKACLLMDPNIDWNFEIPEDQVLGVEAPLWAERVPDAATLEKQIFPRLLAVAENGWTKERDYEEFLERVKAYESVLTEAGIAFTPWQDADIRGQEGVQKLFIQMQQMLAAFGSKPPTDNIPKEVQEEIMASAQKFIGGFFRYTFTPEEQMFIGNMMKNVMGQGL
ncbi:MAG: beta-N-acetylhexosaminidase [Firmicutes bacterium]|nr:beta-N-acetylhexosaminidase [Bacillota bacterium]